MQWKDFYWKVEEFINLFEDLDREDKELFSNALVSVSYTNPKSLCKSLLHIRERFGVDTAKRMFSLATLFRDTEIGTVGELYYYCKSRRLHFASMLYLIPIYAKGDKRIDGEDLINELSWCIEKVAVHVTTAAQKHRSLARAYDKALEKEHNREDMLKQELGMDRIESFVITRFPVITPNQRVVSFNIMPVYLEEGLFEVR